MAEDRFDGLFMNIAQGANGIEPLMDNLFGFLRRKTDFYTAPPEKIHEMVIKALKRQGELYDQEQAKKAAAREKDEKRKKALADKKKKEEQEKAAATSVSAPSPAATSKAPIKTVAKDDDVLELTSDGAFDVSSSVPPTPPTVDSAPAPAPQADDSSKVGGGEKEKEEEEDTTPPPPGNGGSTDKYTWTQTLSEVTVTIKLPPGTKAKMLNVDIRNTSVTVGIKGAAAPLIDGAFHKRVFLDDSLWQMVDDDLVLVLSKDNKMEWWKCVMQGDPEINTQKVQPENSKLSDLDGETRQTVEKMMFDQRQKQMGLPSSEELSKQEMMKKFMKAHPEMDFSKAKFN
jgi:hypothetical protein